MVTPNTARRKFSKGKTPFDHHLIREALDDDRGAQWSGDAKNEAGCRLWLLLNEIGEYAYNHALENGRKRVTPEDITAAFDHFVPPAYVRGRR